MSFASCSDSVSGADVAEFTVTVNVGTVPDPDAWIAHAFDATS